MIKTIIYLEQPCKLLDESYIIIGGDTDGEFMIEFDSVDKAWDWYFKNKV